MLVRSHIIFLCYNSPPVGEDLFIVDASRSHADTAQ
jgi:hypothetical protein